MSAEHVQEVQGSGADKRPDHEGEALLCQVACPQDQIGGFLVQIQSVERLVQLRVPTAQV